MKTYFYTGVILLALACSTTEPAPEPPTNKTITASIKNATTSGFTLTFSESVSGLVATDLKLDNSATVKSITANETNMIFIVVTSELTAGTTYTVSFSKSGYTLTTSPLSFKVPEPDDVSVTATISDVSTAGCTLTFDKPVEGFSSENISLTPTATITSVVADAENKVFTVIVPLTAGETYTFTLSKSGYSFSPEPLTAKVPVQVSASLSKSSTSGFTLKFDNAVADLAIADIALSPEATINSVSPVGIDNKVFDVVTSTLVAGTTYTVALAKSGFVFTGTLSFTVAVSTEANLLSLKIGAEGLAMTVPETSGTSTLANAPHTIQAVVATLLVVAEVSPAATVTAPSNLTSVDFSAGKSVTITVTAEDGITVKNYNFVITPYNATSNPYGIYTPRHLSDMRNGLDGTYKLMNDISLPDMSDYDNTADPAGMGIADYSTKGWLPIGIATSGSQASEFAGSLFGNSKTIRNLTINRSPTEYIGLIGYTNNATLEGITLEIGIAGVKGGTKVGGLVGESGVGSKLDNCKVIGNISGGTTVGGLAGDNRGTIVNCYTTGAVVGKTGVGGFVGRNYNSISKCYANVAVTGDIQVGGFVGWNEGGTISNSYALGEVKGDTGYTGGFAGQSKASSSISYSYSTGLVTANTAKIGGFVGWKTGNTTITSSFWDTQSSGNITGVGNGKPDGIEGKTTQEMQSQNIGVTDIIRLLNDTQSPPPWQLGGAGKYPILTGH